MPTFTWTYVGDAEQPHHIGLYHGKKSGHLVLYVNSRIIAVDFSVWESKTYSFFINEELCEVRLERKGDTFFYTFHINEQVDTPLNRRRKELARKHWQQMLIFLGAMIAVLVLAIAGFSFFKARQASQFDETYFADRGRSAVATIQVDTLGGEAMFSYHFIAGNQPRSGRLDSLFWEAFREYAGIPLQAGDEFLVDYLPANPAAHKLHPDQPTERQVERFFQRVLARHQQLHPELHPRLVACQVQVAFELEGVDGLADFYFQEVGAEENPYHNRQTYLRLTRDLPFQKKTGEACW